MRFLILVLMASSTAYAGNSGGGGKGVVCRNPDGSVKSVEILDLWEGRELHNEIPIMVTGDLATDVLMGLNHLKTSWPLSIQETDGPEGKVTCDGQDCVIKELQQYAQPFLAATDPRLVRLRGVKLEPTNDAVESVEPRDCGIEQIVNYQPTGGQVMIDQDLYDKMDALNKAALIVHEAYYQFLKYYAAESNSLRVRRAVSYVFNGKDLVSLPQIPFKKGLIICHSVDPKGLGPNPAFSWPTDVLVFTPDYYQVEYRILGGTPVIGTTESLRHIGEGGYNKQIQDDLFKSRKCPGLSTTLIMDGPIEYDRQIGITRRCAGSNLDGKSTMYISVRSPGQTDTVTYPLACRPMRSQNDY